MVKKIGVSLREDLFQRASREVQEGCAESVSTLVAEGLGHFSDDSDIATVDPELVIVHV